ncbi:MAG: hypothetical protein R2705_04920 [Ilumatobacteraceae bacterium]
MRKQLAATTKQEATKQAAKQAAKHAAKLTKRAAIEQAKAEALAAEAERAARHGDVYEHLAQHLEAIDVWLRKRDTRKEQALAGRHRRRGDGTSPTGGGLEARHDAPYRSRARGRDDDAIPLRPHQGRPHDTADRPRARRGEPAGRSRAPDQVAGLGAAHRPSDPHRDSRHPWVLEIHDDPPVGPNGIRHFDQTLAAVATYPGSLTDRLDLMAAIDEFVFGFALMERTNFHDPANEPPAPLLDYLGRCSTPRISPRSRSSPRSTASRAGGRSSRTMVGTQNGSTASSTV